MTQVLIWSKLTSSDLRRNTKQTTVTGSQLMWIPFSWYKLESSKSLRPRTYIIRHRLNSRQTIFIQSYCSVTLFIISKCAVKGLQWIYKTWNMLQCKYLGDQRSWQSMIILCSVCLATLSWATQTDINYYSKVLSQVAHFPSWLVDSIYLILFIDIYQ